MKHDFRLPLGRFLFVSYRCTVSNLLFAFTGMELSAGTDIGPGLDIAHACSQVVVAEKIGKNCYLGPQVVIGSGDGGYPTIGDNVKIHSGAKVFGGIVIGDNVVIGANAVVAKSFPGNVVIAGVPAKILRELDPP